MRVLFLCHRSTDTTHGGLAEFLHFLPLALKTYSIDSIIYTQAANKQDDQLVTSTPLLNGVPHYAGPFLKPRWLHAQKELRPLIELCEKERIDLIHAQGTYRAGYMAMHAHKKTAIPYLVTSHSDILEVNSERIKRGNIKRRCQNILKNAAYITHLSPAMAQTSQQLFAAPAKSKIIHNGIDTAAWDAYLNLPQQDYLLAIGRLETEKGFPMLIDTYVELRKHGVKTSLVIAGKGSIEDALKAQAQAHRLNVVTQLSDVTQIPQESVIFTGYVRNELKKELFCRAKLVLFATQPQLFEEAFGIVQLEAMAAGKAMIASDITTTRYLQTFGLQAQLLNPQDISAWQQAILALLSNAEERRKMGNANRECSKQFDWELIAKEYAQVYRAALSQ